jgi:pimeloyl-ACP methyl ester carboxylesterase
VGIERRDVVSLKQVIAAAGIGAAVFSPAARAADPPSVVLVHGAWANGSSWADVAALVMARGLKVTAVHSPLSSFEADVAVTRRVIEDQQADVVLVGHSYGGAVITEAGASDKVRALVYVAAFAPTAGESVNSIVSAHGQPEWFGEIHADSGGNLTWSAEGMARYFAPDIPAEDASLLAATQAPLFAGAFDGQVTTPAFARKPSWFVIAEDDQIIPAALQTFFAERMGATTIRVHASHAAMLSQPEVVADAILAAVADRRTSP